MALRSPTFRKLFLGSLLLLSVTLVILDFYLTRYAARLRTEDAQQRLAIEARILAAELETAPPAPLEVWAAYAGKRAEARVTVIDPRGLVLADSEHDPTTMENHAMRPEIREAYAGRVGTSIRHSATLDRDLCYLAMPLAYGGRPGYVLRLALPLEDLNAAVAAMRQRILVASLAAAVVALIVAYFFTRSFAGRIGRLRAFAESVLDQNSQQPAPPEGSDELGALAGSLRRTASRLRDLVDGLSLESARRQAMLTSMTEGVLAVDSELRVTFSNESFLRAAGAAPPIPDRLPLLELTREPALLDLLTRVLVTGQAVRERLEFSSAEGRTFEVQAAPLVTSSRRGAIVVFHDITELERLERVRKDFVANVSHELRTPLTAIQGYAETLLSGALEDKENNRRFVEVIEAHAIRLNQIASDLLTLSELESGQPLAEAGVFSVRAAVESALHTVEGEARKRNVRLRLEKLEDANIFGSKVRLEQALINLLDNAVKFNRPNGEVIVEAGPAQDGKARIAIRDTGIGIPPQHLSRIFERFYRVDKARSREVGGTGLGLAIVKHVVERLKGSISVESQLGKGSTFSILLPPAPPDAVDRA